MKMDVTYSLKISDKTTIRLNENSRLIQSNPDSDFAQLLKRGHLTEEDLERFYSNILKAQ